MGWSPDLVSYNREKRNGTETKWQYLRVGHWTGLVFMQVSTVPFEIASNILI